jgi:hypothetical protein
MKGWDYEEYQSMIDQFEKQLIGFNLLELGDQTQVFLPFARALEQLKKLPISKFKKI